ncbi:MAG: hypothetical protein E6040_11745 [Lachnospiraceae bacterium]|nr:hypothetical protein [Lachnoanaerobaculum sp.]MDU5598348.1 hypothetical protein [Lachnospiraceae bacterium]
MGGRGSASAGGGTKQSSGGGSIKSLEARKKALGDKMAKLVRQTDKDGQMTSKARKEYYATKSKRDKVVSDLSKAYKADAEARSRQAKSEPAEKKTFVNGYGEATHREITSSTYERAQKRSMKSVEGWLSGRRRK